MSNGKDCPFIHSQKKNGSTCPEGKGKGKGSEKEKVTVAIVNITNHRPRLLQESSYISKLHLTAEGTSSKWDDPKC